MLLSRFPALLVGDQIDPANPRRFVLVRREQGIGLDDGAAARWSIDHLFLDQDGVPTLVEVKRQSDTRIRREVVGQMLDYAANCSSYWSAETLKATFEETCTSSNQSAEAALSLLMDPDQTPEVYWQNVANNLSLGKIRMLFVADSIPIELRRIVEFLNKQMHPAEVLAIELRQFSGEGLKTLVPMVFGQTQESAKKQAKVSVQPISIDQWMGEISEFFGDLKDKAEEIVRILSQPFKMRMAYQNKGAAFYKIDDNGKLRAMFVLRRETKSLEFYLANFAFCTDLADDGFRQSIVDELAEIIPGYRTDAGIDGYPLIKLQSIAASAWPKFTRILSRISERIKSAGTC
ncbi:MAG: hypothetical protein ACLQIQ_19955 [Beijerinckiaceae bacterium]